MSLERAQNLQQETAQKAESTAERLLRNPRERGVVIQTYDAKVQQHLHQINRLIESPIRNVKLKGQVALRNIIRQLQLQSRKFSQLQIARTDPIEQTEQDKQAEQYKASADFSLQAGEFNTLIQGNLERFDLAINKAETLETQRVEQQRLEETQRVERNHLRETTQSQQTETPETVVQEITQNLERRNIYTGSLHDFQRLLTDFNRNYVDQRSGIGGGIFERNTFTDEDQQNLIHHVLDSQDHLERTNQEITTQVEKLRELYFNQLQTDLEDAGTDEERERISTRLNDNMKSNLPDEIYTRVIAHLQEKTQSLIQNRFKEQTDEIHNSLQGPAYRFLETMHSFAVMNNQGGDQEAIMTLMVIMRRFPSITTLQQITELSNNLGGEAQQQITKGIGACINMFRKAGRRMTPAMDEPAIMLYISTQFGNPAAEIDQSMEIKLKAAMEAEYHESPSNPERLTERNANLEIANMIRSLKNIAMSNIRGPDLITEPQKRGTRIIFDDLAHHIETGMTPAESFAGLTNDTYVIEAEAAVQEKLGISLRQICVGDIAIPNDVPGVTPLEKKINFFKLKIAQALLENDETSANGNDLENGRILTQEALSEQIRTATSLYERSGGVPIEQLKQQFISENRAKVHTEVMSNLDVVKRAVQQQHPEVDSNTLDNLVSSKLWEQAENMLNVESNKHAEQRIISWAFDHGGQYLDLHDFVVAKSGENMNLTQTTLHALGDSYGDLGWIDMSTENVNFVKSVSKELAVQAVLIAISGGAASMVRGAVVAGVEEALVTTALRQGARYGASALARGALTYVPTLTRVGIGAIGLATEGIVFSEVNSALNAGVHLDPTLYTDQNRLEAWSSSIAMLGVLHGTTAVYQGTIGKALEGAATRNFERAILRETAQAEGARLVNQSQNMRLLSTVGSIATETTALSAFGAGMLAPGETLGSKEILHNLVTVIALRQSHHVPGLRGIGEFFQRSTAEIRTGNDNRTLQKINTALENLRTWNTSVEPTSLTVEQARGVAREYQKHLRQIETLIGAADIARAPNALKENLQEAQRLANERLNLLDSFVRESSTATESVTAPVSETSTPAAPEAPALPVENPAREEAPAESGAQEIATLRIGESEIPIFDNGILGQGDAAVVHSVTIRTEGGVREAAMKVFHPESQNSFVHERSILEHLGSYEGPSLSQIRDPNTGEIIGGIPELIGITTEISTGRPSIIMERVTGRTLNKVEEITVQDRQRLRLIFQQMQAAGVLRGDPHVENVIRLPNGELKLLDFDKSKLIDRNESPEIQELRKNAELLFSDALVLQESANLLNVKAENGMNEVLLDKMRNLVSEIEGVEVQARTVFPEGAIRNAQSLGLFVEIQSGTLLSRTRLRLNRNIEKFLENSSRREAPPEIATPPETTALRSENDSILRNTPAELEARAQTLTERIDAFGPGKEGYDRVPRELKAEKELVDLALGRWSREVDAVGTDSLAQVRRLSFEQTKELATRRLDIRYRNFKDTWNQSEFDTLNARKKELKKMIGNEGDIVNFTPSQLRTLKAELDTISGRLDIMEAQKAYIDMIENPGNFDRYEGGGIRDMAQKIGLQMEDALALARSKALNGQEPTPETVARLMDITSTLGEPTVRTATDRPADFDVAMRDAESLPRQMTELRESIRRMNPENPAAMREILERVTNPADRLILEKAWADLVATVSTSGDATLTVSEKQAIFEYTVSYLTDFKAYANSRGRSFNVNEVFELLQSNQRKLAHQSVFDKLKLTGSDHSIVHLLDGNMHLAEQAMSNINMTPADRILIRQALIDHDMGYTMQGLRDKNAATNLFGFTKDHPIYSTLFVDGHRAMYEHFFGAEGYQTIHDSVLDHSIVMSGRRNKLTALEGYDTHAPTAEGYRPDVVKAVASMVDCLGTTADVKIGTIFTHPEIIGSMQRLRTIWDTLSWRNPITGKTDLTPEGKAQGRQIIDGMKNMIDRMEGIDTASKETFKASLEDSLTTGVAGDFPVDGNLAMYGASMNGIRIEMGRLVVELSVDPAVQRAIQESYARAERGQEVSIAAIEKAMGDFGYVGTKGINKMRGEISTLQATRERLITEGNDTAAIDQQIAEKNAGLEPQLEISARLLELRNGQPVEVTTPQGVTFRINIAEIPAYARVREVMERNNILNNLRNRAHEDLATLENGYIVENGVRRDLNETERRDILPARFEEAINGYSSHDVQLANGQSAADLLITVSRAVKSYQMGEGPNPSDLIRTSLDQIFFAEGTLSSADVNARVSQN